MPYDSVYSEKRPPGTLRTAWRKFYSDASAMVGLYGCAGLAVLCIFGGWFAPYGIDQQFLGYQLLPPSWSRYGEVSFFLGTDDLGRDVLSRLLSGARRSVAWYWAPSPGRHTASAQRCLTIFWIPYWRSLRCCWQLSL